LPRVEAASEHLRLHARREHRIKARHHRGENLVDVRQR
jgi:hypothetical protein